MNLIIFCLNKLISYCVLKQKLFKCSFWEGSTPWTPASLHEWLVMRLYVDGLSQGTIPNSSLYSSILSTRNCQKTDPAPDLLCFADLYMISRISLKNLSRWYGSTSLFSPANPNSVNMIGFLSALSPSSMWESIHFLANFNFSSKVWFLNLA